MTLDKAFSIISAKCDAAPEVIRQYCHSAEQSVLAERASRGMVLSAGTVTIVKERLSVVISTKGDELLSHFRTVLPFVASFGENLEDELRDRFRRRMAPFFAAAMEQLTETKRKIPSPALNDVSLEVDFESLMQGWEADIQLLAVQLKKPNMPAPTVIYNVTGNNARVNHQSTDNSTNVVNLTPEQLFTNIRDALRSIQDDAEREALIDETNRLEKCLGKAERMSGYHRFFERLERHVSIVGVFLSALYQWAQQ